MIEIIFAANDMSAMRRSLVDKPVEGCLVLFANQTTRRDGTVRLLVQDVYVPAAEDYSRRAALEVELTPETVARVSKRARREHLSLVFVHSHPGDEPPRFSQIDDQGEQHLAAFLSHRVPGVVHAALVVSAGGVRARKLGSDEMAGVIAIGEDRRVEFDPVNPTDVTEDRFDRQVRAFGAEGQRALGRLRIAVVGLGGVGAIVAQQLVHLGVRNFILVDPDVVEVSNLNRLPNARATDVGTPKVRVARRYIRSIAPDAVVSGISENVVDVDTARKLTDADIIFCCTDSHGSRAILQQIAYQYLIPCIDIGTVITASDGVISHVYGRIQLLAPGLACLTCGELLDPNQVRSDMMTAFERQADPYISGAHVPAPAVISLNGTAASLAVTMLLSMVTGVPAKARHLIYNAISSTLRPVRGPPNPTCYICSRSGSFARGDSWPIFGRQD
ncbi:MAG TPA: ThiF family adenylyltransferase [Xanthobacteraceae bacterium]|nr:ThiF family adenylyltransferase [Xanthobacteraceae bacterium]